MKNNFYTFLLLVVFTALSCKTSNLNKTENNKQTAKIIGYLPSGRFYMSSKIEYCKLTHLNLAFANPDASGNLLMSPIDAVIKEARIANPNIKICISLAGGGNLSAETIKNWSNLIDIPNNRPDFINKIVNYVLNNDLDGVDVDLEWDLVTKGYSDFVIELSAALKKFNKITTVALPNNTRFSYITDDALKAFDFINIMSYDATGPWNTNKPGPHSTFEFSKAGIDFWKNIQKIPKDKLILGVPFYGYNFGKSPVSSITYNNLVNLDTAYAYKDKIQQTYYNGIATIEKKVELARDEVGGIMIWELGQDSFTSLSLLNTIHKKYSSLKVKTSNICSD